MSTIFRGLLFFHIYLFIKIRCVYNTRVTIDNLKPRLDIHGSIVDAHDGSVQQFEENGLYYMHAMQYGLCEEPPKYGCDGVSNTVSLCILLNVYKV